MTGGGSDGASLRRLVLVAGGAVLGTLALVSVVAWSGLADAGAVLVVGNVARVVAATMFLTAGGLRLSRWWVTAEARSAYMGASLVVLGGVSLPLWHLARAIEADSGQSLVPVLTRAVGTLVCIGLVLAALARGDDDSLVLHPQVLLARCAGLTAGGFALLVGVGVLLPGVLDAGELVHLAARRDDGLRLGGGGPGRVPPRRLPALGRPRRSPARRDGLRRADAAAGHGVRRRLAARRGPALRGAGLDHGVRRPAATCSRRPPRRTDEPTTSRPRWPSPTPRPRPPTPGARSCGTTSTTRSPASGRPCTRSRRTTGSSTRPAPGSCASPPLAEVEHLAHLVDAADHDEVVDFEVASVVRDVVRTRRATGQRVRLAGTAGVVRGRPGDLARVLQNLLVNAEAHAPGSPVTVQLSGGGGQVEVLVSDRGPGLTEAEAARAFGRGDRGARSEGSGLGLYVSRTLMRKHGGEVELRNRVGGATFVVVLPAVERRGSEVPA